MEEAVSTSTELQFRKIVLKFNHWSNACDRHSEPLIHPKFLERITSIYDSALNEIKSMTLPGFPEDCRWLPDNLQLDLKMRAALCLSSHPLQIKLESALEELSEKWSEALAEAKERLGRKFKESDYPRPEYIQSLYSLRWSSSGKAVPLSSLLPNPKGL